MSWNPQGWYDVEVDYLIGKRIDKLTLTEEAVILHTPNGQTFNIYHVYEGDEEVEMLPVDGDIDAFLNTIIEDTQWEETNEFEKSGNFEFCKYRRLVLKNIDDQSLTFTWFLKNTEDESLYVDFFVKNDEVPEEAL